ncbi:putative RTX family exoprotein [Sulfitobacter noctilucicola]|uniref:Ig-like domain (Group 3) n=1 Tax=Sulfitobacter noctilucicola TaxID=1342301 RepID=A0A7W6Q3T3_9RHOB|nr:Ig-like domain-containing protein [Sulfitobacter noctilucicola]KIN64287.1 putative RTX family exoprotein [Sulfitobacter noctilucicola]MBB4174545.1 hypothetical protein [Sulfitobacter noctilucicola]
MKAIEFVVRDGAGGLERGTVPGGAKEHVIQAGSNQQISLNLRQIDLQTQTRDGDNLVIKLTDGREITIDNYFNAAGTPNRLFVSADGFLNEVAFVDTGAGELYAQYGPTEQWGKWSPSDDLIYLGRTDLAATGYAADEVSLFPAPLLGAAGLLGGSGAAVAAAAVGGAAVIGATGGSGSEASSEEPVVEEPPVEEPPVEEPPVEEPPVEEPPVEEPPVVEPPVVEPPVEEPPVEEPPVEEPPVVEPPVVEPPVVEPPVVQPPVVEPPVVEPPYVEPPYVEPPVVVVPYVNDAELSTDIGGTNPAPQSATVSGGGAVGHSVTVVLGDQQIDTVINADGEFSVTFEGETFPVDGTYESIVTFNGNVELDGPGFVIDTTPPIVEVLNGTESVGDFFNSVSFADGVTLSGLGEAGATLVVTISGIEQSTTVGEDGTWSVSWDVGSLEGGEYSTGATIVSTDAFGNSTTVSETIVIDTISDVTIATESVETDGIVNAVEREDGVTLTGTAQAGSSVMVTFGTGSHPATVDADGNWSVDFAMSEVPVGELMAEVTAVATDSFGNSSSASGMVDIDTLVRDFAFTGTTGGADGVVNIAEASQGLVMTGTTEPGSTVMVSFGTATQAATVAADGAWTVTFAESVIPTGEQTAVMTAVATDIAGNVDTIARNVEIDRDAGILTISSTPVETDDIINQVEASDGVTLTGTSNPGAIVTVVMDGVSKTVTADGFGNWEASYLSTEIAPGVYTADITAQTVDPAGNPLNASDSVEVDTRVDNLDIRSNTVETDGVINGAERLEGGGVQITGTTEVGSTSVVVTMDGVSVNANVMANGEWTADFTTAQVQTGTYNALITAEATDHAGNVAPITASVRVDTEVVPLTKRDGEGGADNTVNIAEAANGIDLGGQVEIGSSVVVNFDGIAYTANVDGAGNWSLTIPPSAIRAGEYNAAITVIATDSVGNVDTLSDTLAIDTLAPEGPVIQSLIEDRVDGFRGISTDLTADELNVYQVSGNGSVNQVASQSEDSTTRNETDIVFNSNVPDGSQLIVTATDAANNTSGTYVVLDDGAPNSTVDITNPVLGNYNIEMVDLSFAEEANLTVDEAALLALSSNSNRLLIAGGSDDDVSIVGAVRQGSSITRPAASDYTLGTEGTIIVDDNIDLIT